MNKIKNIFFFILIIAELACNAPNDKPAKTAMASVGNSTAVKPIVQVVHPATKTMEAELEITGNVEANQMLHLHAMEGGFIKAIHKDIGDYVTSGTLIASLENPDLQQQLQVAKSKLARHEASRAKAQAAIKKAQAVLKLKKSTYERLQSIFDKTPALLRAEDLDNALAEYEIAQAELEGAQAEPNIIQAEIESSNAMVSSYQNRVNMLAVRAPFAGHISRRYMDKGAFVQNATNNVNAKPIVDIVDVSKLRLVVEYPESDISTIQKGSKVRIYFPELAGKFIEAPITRMAAALNPQSKTVRAEIDLSNTDGSIKPGMYAKISTTQKSQASSITVPTQAITAVKNQNFIFTVKDGIVQKMPVELGLEDKFNIEIVGSSLKASDWVIIQGKGLISEGMAVDAREKK